MEESSSTAVLSFPGYCVGILAYGQTSSGKTYTIGTNGVEECYIANPGIISRAASDIFRLAVPGEETTKIIVKVTFMEVSSFQGLISITMYDQTGLLTSTLIKALTKSHSVSSLTSSFPPDIQ